MISGNFKIFLYRGNNLIQTVAKKLIKSIGIMQLGKTGFICNIFNNPPGSIHSHIGNKKIGFQLLKKLIINLFTLEQSLKPVTDISFGFLES